MARLSFPALAFVLLALPARASAQEGATPPEALEAFRSARAHYEAGRYAEAVDDLERAFALDPRSPTLAYNLARVHELMGNLEEAVRHYRLYQQLLPEEQARETDRADATIRRLNGAMARQSTQPAEAAAPAPPARPVEALRELPGLVRIRQRGVADAAFWGMTVTAVVLLATGAIFGALALDTRDQANNFRVRSDGPDPERLDALWDRARAYALVTDLTLTLGLVSAVSAMLLYLLRETTVERAPVREDDAGTQARWLVPAFALGPGAAAILVGVAW